MLKRVAAIAGGFSIGIAAGRALSSSVRARNFSYSGKVVLIAGASRGLGLVMARQLAEQGARLALLARDHSELQRGVAQVRGIKTCREVMAVACDLRSQASVAQAVKNVHETFGSIDVLINNAGIIQVGPMEHMTVADFDEALAVHLYGPLFATLATLPYMRAARTGRIVNISSVGGKVAVPHLLPYCASKFALAGFSEGLRTELQQFGILVTTIYPGLMRTGSPRQAQFKGRHRQEYAWFSISDSLPLLSMNAETAALRILLAARRGDARRILGVHTWAGILFSELFPGLSSDVLGLVNRCLPGPDPGGAGNDGYMGYESNSVFSPSVLTSLTEEAAAKNNENSKV